MEKLYGVPEIMDSYGCAERTARKIMREMGTINLRPMKVRESAIEAWADHQQSETEGHERSIKRWTM